MSNLKYAIYEAEMLGEIDSRIRDKMLDLLNESANINSTNIDIIREDIYERERSAEITVEERDDLLEYLNNAISN